MGMFRKRKSRATRRAEARAIKARAKLEARLAARAEDRRFKAAQRSEGRALKAQLKSQRDSDRAAVLTAQAQLRAVREGKLLSPTRIRRTLTVARLLAPIVAPLVYQAATAARGLIDERRADLSARIAGAEQTLRLVQEKNAKDTETKQFAAAIGSRLADLSSAITAAQNMPNPRRRAAHSAISEQLDGIEADLMARLGVA